MGQMPPSRSALTESMRIDTLMPTYYWPAHALQLSLPNSPRPVSAAPLSLLLLCLLLSLVLLPRAQCP